MPLCDGGGRLYDVPTERSIFLCKLQGELLPNATATTHDLKAVCSECLEKFETEYGVTKIYTWTKQIRKRK